MKLCIAEKPSVAKDIAEVLGAKQRFDGYFEGNGYWVSWTFGHLCTLKEPHDYDEKWKYWRLEDLPAKALGISQSSVSARVKALEDNLGVLLFERHARGVRLTDAGRHFMERVTAGVDQLDHAVKTAE